MTNLEVLEKMLAQAVKNKEVTEHRKPQMGADERINLQRKVMALTEAVELMRWKHGTQ